jgi:hypothetical protein
MKCPKCGGKIFDKCCLKCGYLINGNNINMKEKEDKNIELKIMHGNNYNIMLYNSNWYIPFIFGPLYLSYMGHIIVSCITVSLNILLIPFIGRNVNILLQPIYGLIIMIYILFNRLIYAIFSNNICLKLDQIKIDKLKRKYPKNYRTKIHSRDSLLHPFLTIFILILIILILVIIKWNN